MSGRRVIVEKVPYRRSHASRLNGGDNKPLIGDAGPHLQPEIASISCEGFRDSEVLVAEVGHDVAGAGVTTEAAAAYFANPDFASEAKQDEAGVSPQFPFPFELSWSETKLGVDQRYADCQPFQRLSTALDRATAFDGQGYFGNKRERRNDVLLHADDLDRELIAGGIAAVELAIRHLPPGSRERQPSLTKTALLALEIVAKPKPDQRKSVSDLGCVLFVARAHEMSREAFKDWIRTARVDECKNLAKKIRAALKSRSATNHLDQPGEPEPPLWSVNVSVLKDRKAACSKSLPMTEAAASTMTDILKSVSLCDAPAVLRRLADEIEAAAKHAEAAGMIRLKPVQLSLLDLITPTPGAASPSARLSDVLI